MNRTNKEKYRAGKSKQNKQRKIRVAKNKQKKKEKRKKGKLERMKNTGGTTNEQTGRGQIK